MTISTELVSSIQQLNLKRGFSLPAVLKSTQDEPRCTVFGHMVISALIPETIKMECANWTVLGHVPILRLSHNQTTWTNSGKKDGHLGCCYQQKEISSRQAQYNKWPPHSQTFCRTHLGRCCSTAFTTTSSKNPETVFLRKGWKHTLKRAESPHQLHVIPIHPLIRVHFNGVTSSLLGFWVLVYLKKYWLSALAFLVKWKRHSINYLLLT